LTYNAPGDPELASHIVGLLQENGFQAATSADRGLDHGAWIPLQRIYPEADIPIVAMSIALELSPEELYKIGQALAPLREQGVMILGSGGIVHNLRLVHFADPQAPVERWAAEFDRWFGNMVEQNNLADLFNYEQAGRMRNWPFRHLNTSRRSLWCWVQSQNRKKSQPSMKALSMETSLCKASLCSRKYRRLKPACLLNNVGADAATKARLYHSW
jgi:aromatic ring-opening dioxygenase catalytic subunit (LigB family)